ncbi:MAG: DUF1559 family PulG-like putative transporter [Planctomycetota bacterium]|jgi:beta-lactamase regulating signal transducer with metallopeptidase domain
MNEFGLALLWLMLQISVLCLIALPVYLIARRGHPRTGAMATLATLLLITLVTVSAVSPWPRWSISELSRHDSVASDVDSTGKSEVASSDVRSRSADVAAPASDIDASSAVLLVEAAGDLWRAIGQQPALTPAPESASSPGRMSGLAWTGWLAWLFVGGLAVSFCRLVLGLLAVGRQRRGSTAITDAEVLGEVDVLRAEFRCQTPIQVRCSETITSAATVGWRRPLILLPPEYAGWSASERRGVLAHEIAHISSNDFLCWVCAQAGLLLHFYHPLVHWMARRLRLEQELAADAAAARFSGGAEPYLQTLAALALRQADRPVAWPARTFLPVKGTLMRRVEMLKETRVARAVPSLWRHGAVITLLLAASLVLCGIKPPESRQVLAGDGPSTGKSALAASTPAPPAQADETVARPTLRSALANDETQVAQADDEKQTKRERRKARKAAKAAAKAAGDAFELSFVPSSTNLMLGIRPSLVAGEKSLAPAIGGIEQNLLKSKDGPAMKIADLKQVLVLGFPLDNSRSPVGDQPVVVLIPEEGAGPRIREYTKTLVKTEMVIRGRQPVQLQESNSSELIAATFVRAEDAIGDPQAIAIGRDRMIRSFVTSVTTGNTSPAWADEFKPVGNHQMALALNMAAMRAEIDRGMNRGNAAPNPAAAFAPLWNQTEVLVGGSSLGDTGRVEAIAYCRDKDGAKQVMETAQALIPLGRNMLAVIEQQITARAARSPNGAPAQMNNAIGDSLTAVKGFLDNVEFASQGKTARMFAEADTGSLPLMVGMLLPAVQSARAAARRVQSTNNLKQIALALHNYHSVHKQFPPPVVLGPDGKTPHSWRVAILPYVEAANLYEQYKFDEPWDSENNLQVLKKMPPVFRHPNEAAGTTTSCYFALTGADSGFGEGSEGIRIRDIIDGTSNTLLVVEARREIPWTKPDDIAYSADKPLPKFGGFNPGVWLGALVDGSVKTFAEAADEKVIRAMITRNGREVVNP